MWRFSNIFYAAHMTNQGYDDSLLYFLESFDWEKGLTGKQIEVIRMSSDVHHRLSEFGYVPNAYMRESYICNNEDIENLQNVEISEITQLIAKEKKTFEEHKYIMQTVYKNLHNDFGSDLLLTYYGGYSFIDGYLVSDKIQEYDVFFVHGYKDMPKDILLQLNDVLKNENVKNCQDLAKKEWSGRIIERYQQHFCIRTDFPINAKEKLMKFNIDQCVKFVEDYMYEVKISTKKDKKDYKLILGIDPIIKYITKDSHKSYIKATIDICNRTLSSKESTEKDKTYVKKILSKLV